MIKTDAASKTHAEWRDRIIMTLGGPAWNVELDEKLLDHAIWQTLCLFNKYRPNWKWQPLGSLFNNAQIDFSNEELGTRVVDVKFQVYDALFYQKQHSPFYNMHYNLRDPRKIFNLLQSDDRHRSFLGTQPTWSWDEEKRILHIVISGGALNGMLATALFLVPMRIEQIPFALEVDFLQGAVGYSKLLLARIMRKYGAVPTAQGSINLDGDDLKGEGTEAIKDLEEKLNRHFRHLPPRPIF